MFAVNNGKEIVISSSISEALSSKGQYKVELHCVPQYTFLVDAKNCDEAQKIAFEFTRDEYKRLKSKKKITNAATVQKV